MSLAYTTGGQYVPMVNAKLLAKVIIGGVREEISLDRLMQAAEEDIAREMRRADEEGADEQEKAKRINSIFSSKKLRSHQMKNVYGTASTAAKTYSSACVDMSAMQSAFLSSAPSAAAPTSFAFGGAPTAMAAPFLFSSSMAPPPAAAASSATAEMDYSLVEDEAVSEEQAERVYQKWQHRKK
jgi:hypothetical protein